MNGRQWYAFGRRPVTAPTEWVQAFEKIYYQTMSREHGIVSSDTQLHQIYLVDFLKPAHLNFSSRRGYLVTTPLFSRSSYALALMISTTTRGSAASSDDSRSIRTSRFQTRASDKKSINIRLLRQIPTVLLTDASSIDDPGVFGSFL